MAIQPKNISLCAKHNSTRLARYKACVYKHPTIIKTLKIAGVIFSVGLLLASFYFNAPFGIKVVTSLSSFAVVTSLILFNRPFKTIKKPTSRTSPIVLKPAALSITTLWDNLNKKTLEKLKSINYLSKTDANHRFTNIHCPKKTAVLIESHYLHANQVGNGISQRLFIASQAPLEQDLEMFWKAIFDRAPTIFDLTTIKDQKDGGIIKYYPDKLNETKTYGSMSVKLIQISKNLSTYQIKNTQTGTIKNIQRLHYTDWKDFGAVSESALHSLVKEVERLSPNPKNLIWVHCRAGVGRTGSLITALVLKEKIAKGVITKKNLDTSLVDIIVELRKQRGSAFVQQQAQLDLLRKYAYFLIEANKRI